MSTIARLRTTDITPRTAFFSIGILVLVTTGMIFGVKSFLSGNSTSSASPSHTTTIDNKTEKSEQIDTTENAAAGDPVSETDGDAFVVIAKRNLFKPILLAKPPASKQAGQTTGVIAAKGPQPPKGPQPMGPGSKGPQPPAMPPGINLKTIQLTGIVTMPSGVYALLEELSSKKSEYVLAGGSAFGFRVVSIVGKVVTFEQNGMTATLTLGQDRPDLPAAGGAPPGAKGNNPPGNPNGGPPPDGQNNGQPPPGEGPPPNMGGRPPGEGGEGPPESEEG